MEVYHKRHRDPLSGRENLWKHYFLEFLMLFLAVTAGFLSENWREHILEHKQERQYMSSLILDLVSDTLNINKWARQADEKTSELDSSALIIASGRGFADGGEKLYEHGILSLAIDLLDFNGVTSAELKNSGAMRLISRKDVEDSILTYWQNVSELDEVKQRFEHYRIGARDLSFRIFDLVTDYAKSIAPHMKEGSDRKLATDDASLLVEYGNQITLINWTFRNVYRPMAEGQKARASRLIELIKKRYPV